MKKLVMLVALAMAGALSAATFKFTCDKPDGVYALRKTANVMPPKDKEILIGLGQGHAPFKELRAKLDPWLTQD